LRENGGLLPYAGYGRFPSGLDDRITHTRRGAWSVDQRPAWRQLADARIRPSEAGSGGSPLDKLPPVFHVRPWPVARRIPASVRLLCALGSGGAGFRVVYPLTRSDEFAADAAFVEALGVLAPSGRVLSHAAWARRGSGGLARRNAEKRTRPQASAREASRARTLDILEPGAAQEELLPLRRQTANGPPTAAEARRPGMGVDNATLRPSTCPSNLQEPGRSSPQRCCDVSLPL
jgi:hypothetical protein